MLATALYSLVSVFRFTPLIHLTGHCLTEDRNNSVEDSYQDQEKLHMEQNKRIQVASTVITYSNT